MKNYPFYPDPAKTHLCIQSPFLFHTAEIFSMKGELVLLDQKNDTEVSCLDFNLADGLYLLKINGDKQYACSKLMIAQ